MGNSPNQHTYSFQDQYKVRDHPHPTIYKLESRQNGNLYIGRELSCNETTQVHQIECIINQKLTNPSPFLTRLVKSEHCNEKSFCNTSSKFYLLFGQYNRTLLDEINARKAQNSCFSLEEIESVITRVSKAIKYLYDIYHHHSGVCSRMITWPTQPKDFVQLVDPWAVEPSASTSFNGIKSRLYRPKDEFQIDEKILQKANDLYNIGIVAQEMMSVGNGGKLLGQHPRYNQIETKIEILKSTNPQDRLAAYSMFASTIIEHQKGDQLTISQASHGNPMPLMINTHMDSSQTQITKNNIIPITNEPKQFIHTVKITANPTVKTSVNFQPNVPVSTPAKNIHSMNTNVINRVNSYVGNTLTTNPPANPPSFIQQKTHKSRQVTFGIQSQIPTTKPSNPLPSNSYKITIPSSSSSSWSAVPSPILNSNIGKLAASGTTNQVHRSQYLQNLAPIKSNPHASIKFNHQPVSFNSTVPTISSGSKSFEFVKAPAQVFTKICGEKFVKEPIEMPMRMPDPPQLELGILNPQPSTTTTTATTSTVLFSFSQNLDKKFPVQNSEDLFTSPQLLKKLKQTTYTTTTITQSEKAPILPPDQKSTTQPAPILPPDQKSTTQPAPIPPPEQKNTTQPAPIPSPEQKSTTQPAPIPSPEQKNITQPALEQKQQPIELTGQHFLHPKAVTPIQALSPLLSISVSNSIDIHQTGATINLNNLEQGENEQQSESAVKRRIELQSLVANIPITQSFQNPHHPLPSQSSPKSVPQQQQTKDSPNMLTVAGKSRSNQYFSTIPEVSQRSGSVHSQDERQFVVEQYENGSRYEGYKCNSMRDGIGKFFYQEGSYYDGHWKNNNMHGFGKLYYSDNKLAYVGDWYIDQFHGRGKVYNDESSPIYGYFDYTNFDNLDEKWKYYEGELQYDSKEGEGKLVLSNDEYYEGHFRNDKVDGKGIFVTRNGEVIRGIWEQSKLIMKL